MKKTDIYLLLLLPLVPLLPLFPGACQTTDPDSAAVPVNHADRDTKVHGDDGTREEAWIMPVKSLPLNERLMGTSGLVFWEGHLISHNDHADPHLYVLDTSNAAIVKEYILEGVQNRDWEDLDQDEEYLYLGDFGNNASGNREDLHILRVAKNSLKAGKPVIDIIGFTYSDQQDLDPAGPNQTEFDCEAMVLTAEHIYLFTKQWTSGRTTLYALPKLPGTHVAQKLDSFDIQGLVTGAVYLESKQVLVLSGYTAVLQPFLYLFYDFPGHDFFCGQKRKLQIAVPFLQVEGVTTPDGLTCFLSNESFIKEPAVHTPAQLHRIDLSPFLGSVLRGFR
jgi:hypothetical protein